MDHFVQCGRTVLYTVQCTWTILYTEHFAVSVTLILLFKLLREV